MLVTVSINILFVQHFIRLLTCFGFEFSSQNNLLEFVSKCVEHYSKVDFCYLRVTVHTAVLFLKAQTLTTQSLRPGSPSVGTPARSENKITLVHGFTKN